MSFIGAKPTAVPLTVSDLQNDIINADKISDNSISDEHLDVTSITGQTSQGSPADGDEILVHDTSASALRRFTRSDFLTGVGGSNNIRWMASKISDQTLAYNTKTTIEFSNQVIDVGTCYNDSTYKFTVPSGQGGTYMIGAGGWVYDQQENAEKVDFIIVHTPSGGSANDSWFQSIDTGQSMDSQRIANHISGIQTLSAGDTLHCAIQVVTGDSGTSLFSGSGHSARFRNYFWGYKLIT